MASDTGLPLYALVDYSDPYVQPLLLSALRSRLSSDSYQFIESLSDYPLGGGPLLQIRQYESIVFEFALEEPRCLVNAYIIRKALIRKHYLSTTVANWVTKHPGSALKRHVRPAVDFELDYAEFLDEALVEAYELRESFERNEGKEASAREWWILKPGMSDRGQGIRLFSTEQELTAIFEEWEADQPDSDSDSDRDSQDDGANTHVGNAATPAQLENEPPDQIITSQLRHFVAQPYIHPPLLFSSRKSHIRTYVLAVGALRVYVYKPMLALFAAEPYAPPWSSPDLRAHLTNTCLQGTGEREGSVREFWGLPGDALPDSIALRDGESAESADWKAGVFEQICSVTGELFEAAARGMMVHFQPLPSAFEVFGVDFMLDAQGTAWLLEVNAFPDFRQTGEELGGVIQGLWEEAVDVAVKPFFGLGEEGRDGTERMRKVLDIDLGRR